MTIARSEPIYEFLKKASLVKLGQFFEISGLANEEIYRFKVPVFGTWMSIIMISGVDLRIILKVQYFPGNVKKISKRFIFKEASDIPKLMNDFCSVFAGAIRSSFSVNEIAMGASLPVSTRAFDEVFHNELSGEDISQMVWRVVSQDADPIITCIAVVQVFDTSVLKKLETLSLAEELEDTPGSVEFL